jgi:hypothetical protein
MEMRPQDYINARAIAEQAGAAYRRAEINLEAAHGEAQEAHEAARYSDRRGAAAGGFSGFRQRPFAVPVASSNNVTGLVIIDFLRR